MHQFQALAKQLPASERHQPEYVALTKENLPQSSDRYSTEKICITTVLHFYNQFPVDVVWIEVDRDTLCCLGLLILSVQLHSSPTRVEFALNHPRSTIKHLVIEREPIHHGDSIGLVLQPERFNYYPQQPTRHPWLNHDIHPAELPTLCLATKGRELSSLADLATRDTAIGFGSVTASCLFAELLLNLSRPSCNILEVALESELGFRGVGPGSAEVNIYLPVSLGNLDHVPLDI